MVLENAFDRGDELDADKASVDVHEEGGLCAGTLADFLTRLDDRNKDQPARNGLFASHPETKERIDKIRQLAVAKSGATVEVALQAERQVQSDADHLDRRGGRRRFRSDRLDDAEQGRKQDGGQGRQEGRAQEKGFGLGALKPARRAGEARARRCRRRAAPEEWVPIARRRAAAIRPLVKVTVTDAEVETFKKGVA